METSLKSFHKILMNRCSQLVWPTIWTRWTTRVINEQIIHEDWGPKTPWKNTKQASVQKFLFDREVGVGQLCMDHTAWVPNTTRRMKSSRPRGSPTWGGTPQVYCLLDFWLMILFSILQYSHFCPPSKPICVMILHYVHWPSLAFDKRGLVEPHQLQRLLRLLWPMFFNGPGNGR